MTHGGDLSVVATRSRLGVIVGVSAVLVGSTIGSALALRGEPAPERLPPPVAAAPAANPQAAAVAPSVAANPAAGATAAAVLPSPDARAALIAQIKDALRRFVAWSHAHPGARCPDAAALGVGPDPWGQPLRIVCSDQPPDQIAGVLSYGPDGEPGTRDDVASWTLGPGVTELARGSRWSASRGIAPGRRAGAHASGPRAAPPAAVPPAAPTPPRSAGSNDSDGDGIPDRR